MYFLFIPDFVTVKEFNQRPRSKCVISISDTTEG